MDCCGEVLCVVLFLYSVVLLIGELVVVNF